MKLIGVLLFMMYHVLSPPQADRGGFVAISAVNHDRGPEIVNKGLFEPNKVLLSINRLQLSDDIVVSRVLQRIAKSGTCCTCNGGSMYGVKGERIDLIRLKKLDWDEK